MKTEAITFDQLVSGVLLYQGNTNTHMFNDVFKAINIVKLLALGLSMLQLPRSLFLFILAQPAFMYVSGSGKVSLYF